MMQDFGGLESFTPSEGASSASEQLSEAAKQRFAQAQQQIKQIIREEKKARKRDDRVASTIRQFLGDAKYAHLFQLISRLAARDCPSIFILAILSLIHEGSLQAVDEFIAEQKMVIKTPEQLAISKEADGGLPKEAQRDILLWTSRLELVMSTDAERILSKLMVDEGNIDGTVLQLTTFVLVDYFESIKRGLSYEQMQPMTVKILQDILEPYMDVMEKYFARLRAENKKEDDDE
jgi:hypothetical protein